jgi:hypothetical protein
MMVLFGAIVLETFMVYPNVFGAGALVLSWPVKAARWWILFSLAMIVCEGVASVLYFWPRNEIMFVEGSRVHSAEYLKQVAREFETWHWRRMGFNAAAVVCAFVGFLRFYRHRLFLEGTHRKG